MENLAGAGKARLGSQTAPLIVRNLLDCVPMLLVCFTSSRVRGCRFINDEAVIEIRHAPAGSALDVLREIPVYLFSIQTPYKSRRVTLND
jgi:hypothetical protein